jgi:diadenosine tetraphosphate (Ap4A) HIT family hydrolase
MDNFILDHRLEADSVPLGRLSVCQVRLMNDGRWPWLVLVPMRHGAVELHDLPQAGIAAVFDEILMASRALKSVTGALKINTGALGNVVRQLHIHVVARNEGDPNWPAPVWGFGARQPYAHSERDALAGRIAALLFQTEDKT